MSDNSAQEQKDHSDQIDSDSKSHDDNIAIKAGDSNQNDDIPRTTQDDDPAYFQATQPDTNLQKYLDIVKIFSCRYHHQKRQYTVKLRNQLGRVWYSEEKIDPQILEEFHKKNTLTGKRRKRSTRSRLFSRHIP
ncbi:hypothetical protein SNE40_018450 [Patella caerulea]|uniref:Uncharacterized protein n=1 Tax=Patella caerulea TaxID=87958 RepID=A0AAN8P7W4_PATCE